MKRAKALVVGNWKLNPADSNEAKTIFSAVQKKLKKDIEATVVIAPPAIFIPEVAKASKKGNIALGAQYTFYQERGPATGEVGPGMLASFGVSYVIVGHSEKRLLGITDEDVNKKVHALLKRKLTPIVCIGERERDDQGTFYGFVEEQIKRLTQGLTPAQLKKLVIAYEPIWAIGTGKSASVEDIKEMQLFIISTLAKLYDRKVAEKVVLLYGGSVKPSIAKNLYKHCGMNGFLVGGASLRPDDFCDIVQATI
jgi:triosephosphate isomerase